jgi:DNA-binding NarL/FixJ family response regulator
MDTLKGGATMTPSIALKTLKLFRNPLVLESKQENECIQLTAREIEVLDQLSKGLQYYKIADNLIVSIGTIRKHVENIYKKLQVHNKLQAIQKAKENNLL